jgi:hypothetical protein
VAIASPIQNQKAKGQPAARRYQRFRDNHGRRWGAVIENKTGDPVGNIEPVGTRADGVWRAPWMPEQKYLKLARDEDGAIEVGRLEIDYKTMLKDAKQEKKDADEWMEFVASQLYGERAGEMVAAPPAQLRRYMKGKPRPPEIIVAAMNGDRWLLGFEQGECPDYLKPYFPKYQPHSEDLGDDETDLDPAFVEGLRKRFEEAKIKNKTTAPAAVAAVAEQARADAEREDQREADKKAAAARARGH